MNKKELVISAKFDTSDFDKSVESMQKKLKDIYAPADQVRAQTQMASRLQQMGMGGIMSNPGQAGSQAAMANARRELEQQIRTEALGQEKLGKFIAQRVEKLKELKKLQDEMTKGSAEELAIKERIAKMEENISRQRDMYNGRAQGISQMMDARNYGTPAAARSALEAYQQGGVGGVGQWAGANKMAALGTVAGALGSIGTGMVAVGGVGDRLAGYDQRLEAARGQAVANSTGQDLRDVYGGRSAYESVFSAERSQATGLANEKEKSNRIWDRVKGGGSLLSMAGGVALVGGGIATGAAALAGAPFTAGTSTLGLPAAGAMITGGIGMLGVGTSGLMNDRTRKSVNPFDQKGYDQLLAAEKANDFRRNYENLKEQDPAKKAAMEMYEQNRLREVALQRQLGLSDKGLYGEGGLKQQATAAGFVPDQVMAMASSIIQAGGSARMGKNAVFGSQMERAGLTNAGQVLGSLSGSIQSPEATKRATISIMSEAFKIGLDNTDFAEENRRFTQAAANIIGRSGATSVSDQDRLTNMLGQFLGERTNAGVQAAQDAYEKFQQRGSALGGRRGAMRFHAARQNENFSRLDTNELVELLGARPEDIKEDSAAMRYLAEKAGFKDVGAMQSGLDDLNKQSRFLIPGNKNKFNSVNGKIQEYMRATGKSYSEIVEMAKTPGALPKDVETAFGQASLLTNYEESGGFKDINATASMGEFFKDVNPFKKGMGKGQAEQALSGSDRMSDRITESAAQGAEAARKKFDELSESLLKAAQNAQKFTDATTQTADALGNTAIQRQQAGPKGDSTQIARPLLQPQTGKAK